MSQSHLRIVLLPGDGVGPELADAVRACVDALNTRESTKIELVEFPVGYAAYRAEGTPLPDRTIEAMRGAPASLLTALSVKECPPPSVMGQIRQKTGLFADVRHCVSRAGSPRSGVDLVMFRECSEGFLADRNMHRGAGEFMPSPDVALSVRVVTRQKCQQIAKLAFQYAQSHGRKKITVAHKDVVFSLGCGLFRDCVRQEARNFPSIILEDELVDDLGGHLVTHPERYDMILSTNMFGDILADVAAAQVGGMVPVVNASATTAFFCSVHAAHNEMAGKQVVNPVGTIRTLLALLYWLGLNSAAGRLENAIAACENPAVNTLFRLPEGLTTSKVTQRVVQSILS